MSPTFDPYYKWLAIPPAEQPPNHYRLLALNLFESDADVIATAADQRMAHVRSFQSGQYVDASQRLLNELATARLCLLRADKKAAYDAGLRGRLAEQAARTTPPPAPPIDAGPILPPPPLVSPSEVDDLLAPIEPPARRTYPAHRPEPAAQTFVVETDQPDTVQSIAAEPTSAHPATWQDDDDPLGLADSADRFSKRTALARPRKPAFPRIFLLAPLAGVAAVIAAVLYTNIRDAIQESDRVTATGRSERTVKHPVETSLHTGGSLSKTSPGSNPEFIPPLIPNDDTTSPISSSGSNPPVSSTPENSSPSTSPEKKEPTAARLPVPDADAQRKSLAEIKSVYKDEFGKATTLEGRTALARKLTDLATGTKEDPTARYVLATQALELSVKLCDAKQASALVLGLSLYYDVDTWELKAKTLSQLAAVAKTPEARQLIANGAFDLVDKALIEDRYDAAVLLAASAADLAALLPDPALRKKTIEAHTRALRMRQEAAEVQAAQERLAHHSDDAAAHLLVGRYYCMEKNDWDSGLPHLIRGGDAELTAIAQLELAGAAKPTEQVTLADAWWDLADRRRDSSDAPLAKGMRTRAVYWYRRAMPQLSGFGQSKAQKRIAEATATTPAKP